MRIDKFISANTAFSRSEIRLAAKRGKITVNGIIEKAFDKHINPKTDIIKINDNLVTEIGYVYIVINKPAGVISASNDKNKETVVDLLPEKYSHLDLFPVGRLDKDTTGLLIITNDGEFAHKVISPKNDVPKCYLAELDASLDTRLVTEFSKGVTLADGTCCKPSVLAIINDNTAKLTITEGKYHQVKRMFGVFGLGVNKLHRLSIGKLHLPEDLEAGEFIEMPSNEVINKVLKSL